MQILKKITHHAVKICLAISAIVLLKQFCSSKTDGFALYKICSSLCFNPDWETTPLSPQERDEVLPLFDQPFYYLAKGAQSYVFVSADGQTVIKFFRLYHLRPPLYLSLLTLPLPLQPYKINKMLEKRQDLDKDFQSYKIAFEKMREESGLLYLHLNKTSHLKKTLTFYNKIGVIHHVDLDQMEFLVQKRALLVYPAIDHLVKTQGIDSAKRAISSLVKLLMCRYEKGIFDKDPDLNTNFGFLGTSLETAVQIDIGRFQSQPLSVDRNEILRITDNFRQWLDRNYPELSGYLLSEINQIGTL